MVPSHFQTNCWSWGEPPGLLGLQHDPLGAHAGVPAQHDDDDGPWAPESGDGQHATASSSGEPC